MTVKATENDKPMQIRRARTADNQTLILWSDGQITRALGLTIKGIGTPRNTRAALKAASMVMGDAELYDMSEIAELFKCARKAKNVADMRARFANPGARIG